MGRTHLALGNYEDAVVSLEKSIDLALDYSNARYFLGLTYDRQGKKQKAIEQFVIISELNPDNVVVESILNNLKAGNPAHLTVLSVDPLNILLPGEEGIGIPASDLLNGHIVMTMNGGKIVYREQAANTPEDS